MPKSNIQIDEDDVSIPHVETLNIENNQNNNGYMNSNNGIKADNQLSLPSANYR